LYKLLNEEGVWQELLYNKYLWNKSLLKVTTKPTDSPFWKELMGVKDDFSHGDILRSAMGRKLDYGRMFGWGNNH
jgi:hypothetical protein